ncbi:MAG: PD-(D/E)XK nuclease family protein [Patescibacteria group bacterium]|nr:PD-(D/E)XK nuclease family protein [Patescibacteria group bacterium]
MGENKAASEKNEALKFITFRPYRGRGIEVKFEENPYHRYTINGRKILSVTSVTGLLDKSGPLMWWATGEMAKAIEAGQPIEEARRAYLATKKEAADLGTRAHQFAQDYIEAKNPEIPEGDPKLQNAILAFLRLWNDSKIKPIAVEKHLYSKDWDYAGRCDLVATIGGRTALIDFKTSKAVYTEFRYQTAAYAEAYSEMKPKTPIKNRYVFRFDKETGEPEIVKFPPDDFMADINAFLNLLSVKRREEKIKDKKNEKT